MSDSAKERAARALALDPDHFKNLGARGGKTTATRHGRKHLAALGRKGGKRNAAKGSAHFSRLGKKGGARLRELVAAGRRTEKYAEEFRRV